jgi:hypothetical protein
MICRSLFVVLMVLLPVLGATAQTIRFDGAAFRVTGWSTNGKAPADLESIFAVYAGGPDAPSMLGNYSVEGESLVFRPRFPITAGIRYRAVFYEPGRPPIEMTFDGPQRETAPSTYVEHVYPSTNILPSNQLKLYIYFSAPMSRGESWKRIHLLDDTGQPVQLPFLEIEQELWDPSYRRLTVLFDPGRIKRGLAANDELGPAIVEGRQYTLVIDGDFLDARGVPLEREFRKSFRGGPADRKSPDPKEWRVSQPRAETRDPLIVQFGGPMDQALLLRLITIPGVGGSVATDREETQWRFTPDQPWMAGDYHLVVDVRLEDLAGNRIDRVFDADTLETPASKTTADTVSIPFRVSR